MSIYGLYDIQNFDYITTENSSANNVADPKELEKLAVLPMLRALVLLGKIISNN